MRYRIASSPQAINKNGTVKTKNAFVVRVPNAKAATRRLTATCSQRKSPIQSMTAE
jgi:hypothetical protein